MTSRVAAVLATLVVVAALSGCGSGSSTSRTSTVSSTTAGDSVPPNLVTATDIARTQAGSPSRVVLEWFQAVQFQDPTSLRRLSTPDALRGLTDATLSSWLATFGPGFARPKISAVLTTGATSLVRLLLLSYSPPSRTPLSPEQPFTLRLKRVAGKWLVADVALLRTYARAAHLIK